MECEIRRQEVRCSALLLTVLCSMSKALSYLGLYNTVPRSMKISTLPTAFQLRQASTHARHPALLRHVLARLPPNSSQNIRCWVAAIQSWLWHIRKPDIRTLNDPPNKWRHMRDKSSPTVHVQRCRLQGLGGLHHSTHLKWLLILTGLAGQLRAKR